MDDLTPQDRVRALFDAAEDVDLPDGVADRAEAAATPPPGDLPPQDDAPHPVQRCADLPLNDVGNGQRVVVHFGEDLLSVPRVGWFLWDGRRFVADPDDLAVRRKVQGIGPLIEQEVRWLDLPDGDAAVLGRAERTAEELAALRDVPDKDRSAEDQARLTELARYAREADAVRDKRDKAVGRRLTHAKNAGNTNAINNMLREAAALIAQPLEALDRGPLDINTLGGLLRFSVVPGEDEGGAAPARPVVHVDRLDHDRGQLLTKIMPVNLDPAARCPTFDAFLARILPSPEMRRFVQRWFGYSMTGLTNEQKFAFFYGSGANGKSVLVDLMAKVMGDYAASAKIESITGRNRRGGGDATPDLVPLIGARFVRTSEPDEGQLLQEGLIKELTGGEPILVRALNENFVTVTPIFKLTISGNHRPEIRGGDDGIWRRVLLVPFEVQIPPEERDPEMGAKLWAERDGVMNWLIGGLRDYLAHGLQVPDTVVAATEEYRADSDPLGTFLSRVCLVTGDPRHAMRAKDLTEAFAFWLDDTGGGAWTPRTIQKRLKGKEGRWKHPDTGQTFTARKSSDAYYDGIALLEPFKTRFEDHQARGATRARPVDDGGGW